MANGEWELINFPMSGPTWVRPIPKKGACVTCRGEGGIPRNHNNADGRPTTYYVTCPACNGRGH